jgi:pimeloyl-ACP methyl ester carboxylesterase
LEFDRTVAGKDLLPEEKKNSYGQYPELGEKTLAFLPHSDLIVLPGMGHILHVQGISLFKKTILKFLIP